MRKLTVLIRIITLSAAFISCSSLRHIGYENGHKYVDLGLSVKWSTTNIGAKKPQESGDSYAWGETEPKSVYSWHTYKFREDGDTDQDIIFSKYVTDAEYGQVDGKTTLEPEDDVARVRWGGSWRMPTASELDELMADYNCTWTYKTRKGVIGYKIKSKKKGYKRRSIFLPIVKQQFVLDLDDAIDEGIYWSSSLFENTDAWMIFLLPDAYSDGANLRCVGLPVRPVTTAF